MCLGSGSSKPKLQERTLPAEGTRPADEITRTNQPVEAQDPKYPGLPKVRKNWDDVDAANPTGEQKASQSISDSGIQY